MTLLANHPHIVTFSCKNTHFSVINGNLQLFNTYMLQMLSTIPRNRVKVGDSVLAGQMGKFPRSKELRNKAGLDLSTLVAKLGAEGPKERSVRKLEEGGSIRLAGAYRVGHVLNACLKEKDQAPVDLDTEIESL